ncbi:hypothetical protein AAMO2058_000841200 [Amorphochlora amoebiformis]|mmetsp:Transcript_27259/g.43276  ORF Transcript_27259/g.43276 Transcript_27259/m.43276 type:complete len:203 (-) Transcript_27259:140-748(-)
MFSLTKRLSEAVSLTNKIEQKRFPKVLSRVINHLAHPKTDKMFTTEEEKQLSEILGLNVQDLDMVLSLSIYVFEEAAYHNCTAGKLKSSLQQAGMAESPSGSFSTIWQGSRSALISKLQAQTLGAPKVLSDVDWRLNFNMSSQSAEKEKEIKSILTLALTTPSGSASSRSESMSIELDRAGLVDLYSKLEKIQNQIDALTKK